MTTAGLKKVAAMVILRHQEKYLLLKRAKAPNKGMYVPVGGKLEPYEDPLQAALRETKEETGLEIRAEEIKFCGTLIETSPVNYNWMCYIYLAEIADIEPPFCDEGELHWVVLKDLLELPTPPTDWQIYQYVLRGEPFSFRAIYDKNLQMLNLWEDFAGKRI